MDIKKDIYLIKNKINGKLYVGQSVDYKHRWEQHVSAARHEPRCVIDQAIKKYGENNFELEELYHQISNYNHMEKELIQSYNSLIPNGYNVSLGGSEAGIGIQHPRAKLKTQEDLELLIDFIRNSKYNFNTIAELFNISPATVSDINNGRYYRQDNLEYPLRLSRYDVEKIKQITYSLKYELDKTLIDIAKEYKIDMSYLNDINQGRSRYRSYLQYPLRSGKITNAGCRYILEIIDDLQHTSLSQDDIARKYNVSKNTVSQINLGKSYSQPNINYPIRKNHSGWIHTTFSPEEIAEIENLLENTNMSQLAISRQVGCASSTINNINQGHIKKYYNPNKKYPLRK